MIPLGDVQSAECSVVCIAARHAPEYTRSLSVVDQMRRVTRRVQTQMYETRISVEHAVFARGALRRHRAHFDDVRRFCLFVGYPRSGHSLVGAMLNAHPRVVIAHEANVPELIERGCERDALFARLLARAEQFDRRGNESNYAYGIPGGWQGRYARLDVIGDKRGGAVTRRIARDRDFLKDVRALVGIPIRLVHVVRHPLDNITAISRWSPLSLDESIDYYFTHCETTTRLEEWCREEELLTLHHESFFDDPTSVLRRLADHIGVEPEAGWLRSCKSVLFPSPTYTRGKGDWSDERLARVRERAAAVPFLSGYEYTRTP